MGLEIGRRRYAGVGVRFAPVRSSVRAAGWGNSRSIFVLTAAASRRLLESGYRSSALIEPTVKGRCPGSDKAARQRFFVVASLSGVQELRLDADAVAVPHLDLPHISDPPFTTVRR